MPGDACLVASLVAARLTRRLREGAEEPKDRRSGRAKYRIPAFCRRCVLDAVPYLAARACGDVVSIEWTHELLEEISEKGCSKAVGPRVGILGNALLCFDDSFGGATAAVLAQCGCTPVYPSADLLFGEDVSYREQLGIWHAEGVRDVVYLLGFGCLKGHVSVRGRLRELALEYPGMRLTVIDCDAQASRLNRENRIRLAANEAHERGAEA